MMEVVAALIWDKDKFLICQRPANKARALLWEFVGGKVEKGETKQQDLMKYMLNAYRVLLTRARAGMVICVPEGNGNKNPSGFWEDSTRLPEYYNGTYEYLKSLGIEEI